MRRYLYILALAVAGCLTDSRDSIDGRDAAPDVATGTLPDASPLCTNHDGTIERSEITLAAGQSATYRIAAGATVDTSGTATPGAPGQTTWDLSGALTGDHDAAVTTISPLGAWWASTFPDATYAAQLTASSDLLGVFRASAGGLDLIGVVSPQGGPTRTLLTYSPAAAILRFPLAANATFSTTSTVAGQADGLGAAYTETYDSVVDAAGTLRTPYGDFPVLRLRTTLTRIVAAVPAITRSFAWLAECYGVVGAVTSLPDEPQVEFTTASDARRLAP